MSVGYLKKCSSGGRPKQVFTTQEKAEAFRSSLIRIGRWTPGNSNTYYCGEHGGYHAGRLGRANRGKGRKKAAKRAPFLPTQ